MEREAMLSSVDTLYEGRTSGDLEKFAEVLAGDAVFRFAGDTSIVQAFPGGNTRTPSEVAQALFEQIDMKDRRRIAAVVEGNRVAVLFQAKLRAKGGEWFEHEMFDLWVFNEDGKIVEGTQYQDTAKIVAELKASDLIQAAQA